MSGLNLKNVAVALCQRSCSARPGLTVHPHGIITQRPKYSGSWARVNKAFASSSDTDASQQQENDDRIKKTLADLDALLGVEENEKEEERDRPKHGKNSSLSSSSLVFSPQRRARRHLRGQRSSPERELIRLPRAGRQAAPADHLKKKGG